MSATFARFHPNLILGGTYSGQIVLWDNRVGQKVPALVIGSHASSLLHEGRGHPERAQLGKFVKLARFVVLITTPVANNNEPSPAIRRSPTYSL